MKFPILAAAASATLYKVCIDFNQPCELDFEKLKGTWYTAGANYDTCKCTERIYDQKQGDNFPVKMQCIEKSKNGKAKEFVARIHDKQTMIMRPKDVNEGISKAVAMLTPTVGQGQSTERFINAWHDGNGNYKYIAINFVTLKKYYIYGRETSIPVKDATEIDNYIARQLSSLNKNFWRKRFGAWKKEDMKTIWNTDASNCKRDTK